MLVEDLVWKNFDLNAKYRVYDCTDGDVYNENAPCIWDSEKHDHRNKPPDELLNMEITYVTVNNNTLEIEAQIAH